MIVKNQKVRRYTREELIDFIGRATTMEMLQTARNFIAKLELPEDLRKELEFELMLQYDACEEYINDDRGSYSPSAPWNAPGMKVSDFI